MKETIRNWLIKPTPPHPIPDPIPDLSAIMQETRAMWERYHASGISEIEKRYKSKVQVVLGAVI